MATHNKIKKEEIDLICSGKYSSKDLSKMLNRHRVTINKIAHQNNIILPKEIHRKYMVNEDYFRTWSKEMAWILGIIIADAHVKFTKRNGGILSICLQERDIEILNNIKTFMQFSGPINKKFNYEYQRYYPLLTICSVKIVQTLSDLKCEGNKTFKTEFPPNIPSNLISHFCRGIFDGDGYLGSFLPSLSNNPNLKFQITGQLKLLEQIKNAFNVETGTDFGCIYKIKNENCYNLNITGIKSALIFGKWLYNDSLPDIRLNRKYYIWEKYYLENQHKLSLNRAGNPINTTDH